MDRLLLVEDDPAIVASLQVGLKVSGFEVVAVGSLRAARKRLEGESFAVILLDVNLPDGLGLDLCRELRESGNGVPIVVLTANGDEDTAVKSLSLGATDHMRKPFGMQELVVRLRRSLNRSAPKAESVSYDELSVQLAERRACVGAALLELTKRQFDILALLVKRAGEVVAREEILGLWDEEGEVFDRTIDSHMSHLRKKLREGGAKRVTISPVYGVGYRLERK